MRSGVEVSVLARDGRLRGCTAPEVDSANVDTTGVDVLEALPRPLCDDVPVDTVASWISASLGVGIFAEAAVWSSSRLRLRSPFAEVDASADERASPLTGSDLERSVSRVAFLLSEMLRPFVAVCPSGVFPDRAFLFEAADCGRALPVCVEF